MKQKKKQNVNNKFNFDDEYIIGVSTSASPVNKVATKKKKTATKKNTKQVKKQQVNNKQVTKKQIDKKKMNSKKLQINKKITKIVAVIFLFVGAGCFLCLSPVFNVQEIIVENNNIISDDTIRSLSRIQLYKNIFLINKLETISNVQENPYINTLKVSRILPNKIKIQVEEREEKYLLEFAEGKYAILDGQGYVLAVTSELKEMVVIIGGETNIEELVKVNGNKNRLCEKDLKKLDTVAKIIQIAESYEINSFITKIDISDEDNIKLILDTEEKIVYLGSCSDLNTRIQYMKEILNKEKGKKGIMFINGNLSTDRAFFRENV